MNAARLRVALARGLGNRKTRTLGVLLIALGVLGKLALRDFANIETVFVATLLAGSLLGGWWTVLVPMAALAILEPILWAMGYEGYPLHVMVGITFFVVTGFLFVGLVGWRMKPRILFRVGSLALLTTISVPLTLAYDLWTDIGEYYFIARPMGLTFWDVLLMQVPFSAYHVLSSLIFVPLFGAGFLYLHHVAWPTPEREEIPGESPEDA